jgi:hypothetical protein
MYFHFSKRFVRKKADIVFGNPFILIFNQVLCKENIFLQRFFLIIIGETQYSSPFLSQISISCLLFCHIIVRKYIKNGVNLFIVFERNSASKRCRVIFGKDFDSSTCVSTDCANAKQTHFRNIFALEESLHPKCHQKPCEMLDCTDWKSKEDQTIHTAKPQCQVSCQRTSWHFVHPISVLICTNE